MYLIVETSFQLARLMLAFSWSMISSNLRVRERLLMFKPTSSRGEYVIYLSQCALISLSRALCLHLLLPVWSVSRPHLWLNPQKVSISFWQTVDETHCLHEDCCLCDWFSKGWMFQVLINCGGWKQRGILSFDKDKDRLNYFLW